MRNGEPAEGNLVKHATDLLAGMWRGFCKFFGADPRYLPSGARRFTQWIGKTLDKPPILWAVVCGTASFAAVVITGAVWGGLNRVAPCSGGSAYRSVTEQIEGGILFGMMYFGLYFAVPAALIGGTFGGIITAIVYHRKSRKRSERHRI